jgi:hypothetical protein
LLLIASCKTQKVRKTTGKESLPSELEYTTFNVPKATFTFVQKQNSINVNGTVRIRKDSIIVLSIQPLLGVEVGRASITRHSVTVVDRINRRYFKADFDSLRKETGININYYAFQAIFTNALFIYDNPGQVQSSAFEEVKVGELSLLQTDKEGLIQEFNINNEKRVMSGRMFMNSEPFSIGWNYQNFNSLESGYFFPHLVKITVSDGKEQHRMDVSYNKIELDKKLNFNFPVPSSYTQVTLEELLKMLQ